MAPAMKRSVSSQSQGASFCTALGSVNGLAGQQPSGERGVLGAAVPADLVAGEAPPVVQIHGAGVAVGPYGHSEVDDNHDVGVAGGERQRSELCYVDALSERGEEVRQLCLAVVDPVPGSDVGLGFGRPVHILGDLVEDGSDVAAAERLVYGLDGLDFGVHGALLARSTIAHRTS